MLFSRETGALLHPTSLPGPWGIGTLGSEAEEFIRWMAASGITVWQVLPLSPPVYANSPYQALSSFALNPLLVSPEVLVEEGYLQPAEVKHERIEPGSTVNWEALRNRLPLLEKAAHRALSSSPDGFNEFLSLRWVQEWSRFAAKKEMNLGKPWHLWKNSSPPARDRELIHGMIQFFLHRQWSALRRLCFSLGIRILGDVPIYTAHDSSDVFFNRSIFKLLPSGLPAYLAGVPPDYFSRTGQLWGNPVYDWKESKATGHGWWISRIKRAIELFDAVRIDHFRGFDSYWEIPAGAETAADGRWVKGPGYPFFETLEKNLGKLPLIAEDLGVITESVCRLRRKCGFPGMTVLQFALQDPEFRVKNISSSTILYTGTHDNDTTAGWISSKGCSLGYGSVDEIVSMALSSPAVLAVIPMQDILKLESTARMNTPATAEGNWSFRLVSLPEHSSLSRSK